MTNYLITSDGRKWVPEGAPPPPPPPSNLWRVKSDTEIDKWGYEPRNSAPAPCVFRVGDFDNPSNSKGFPMTQAVQIFCANLLAFAAYKTRYTRLTGAAKADIQRAFTALYASDKAFTNKSGFPADNDPTKRANFIKGENTDRELPKFDASRVCPGIFKGWQDEEMVKIAHFSKVPDKYGIKILNNKRVFIASIVYPDGHLGNFPQLKDSPLPNSFTPVPVPLMANQPLYYYKKWMEPIS